MGFNSSGDLQCSKTVMSLFSKVKGLTYIKKCYLFDILLHREGKGCLIIQVSEVKEEFKDSSYLEGEALQLKVQHAVLFSRLGA